MQHFPLTEKLHTDVLEEKYGPISSRVLKHTDSIREALLVDSNGVARTYAITFFNGGFSGEVAAIHAEIKAGKPIGKAFRERGYIVRKNVLDVFIISIPAWLKKEFKVSSSKAKARLSEFYAKKAGESPIIYGIVTEIYTPDFRKAVVNRVDSAQVSPMTEYLENEGISKESIWMRIGNDNNYDDTRKKFSKARGSSKSAISSLKKRILAEIKHKG